MFSEWLKESENIEINMENQMEAVSKNLNLEERLNVFCDLAKSIINQKDPFIIDAPSDCLILQNSPTFAFNSSQTDSPQKNFPKKSPDFGRSSSSNRENFQNINNIKSNFFFPIKKKSKSVENQNIDLETRMNNKDITPLQIKRHDSSMEDLSEYDHLLESARCSLSHLLPKDSMAASREPFPPAPSGDCLLSYDQSYNMTDYSSNESSNNITHEYCLRDPLDSPSVSRIVDSSFNLLSEKEDTSFNSKTSSFFKTSKEQLKQARSRQPNNKRLYCNNKLVPRWAEKISEVAIQAAAQKEQKSYLKSFGVLRGIDCLNLECVFNIENDEYNQRGESAIWNTPESRGLSFTCKRGSNVRSESLNMIYEAHNFVD